MSNEEPRNLPAMVLRHGGALVEVLGWPQYADLSEAQQLEVAVLVRSYPDTLGTAAAVDLLADATTFYQEKLDLWFASLLQRYDIAVISMAMDALYQLGERGGERTAVDGEREAERFDLDDMLGLIDQLERLGHTSDSPEHLCAHIERLGGWEVASMANEDLIRDIFDGTLHAEDVRADLSLIKGEEDAGL